MASLVWQPLIDSLMFNQHELPAADRGATIPDYVASLREILTPKKAKKLCMSPSTISRQLRRNSLNTGSYEPDKAQIKAYQRRHSKGTWSICENTRTAVELMLELNGSPEQVFAICKRTGRPAIVNDKGRYGD